MASSIAAKTICTVYAIQDTGFLHDPHNAQFLVSDEGECYESDPYASRASPFSPSVYSEAEEQTPTRSTSEPFLRITTDHTPQDPTVGFAFGRDPSVCDVLLPWGRKKISSRHFSVGPNNEGNLVLKNRSAKCTLVDSAALGKVKLVTQTAIPEGGAEAKIQAPHCKLKIRIRFHGFTEPGFKENWETFLESFSLQVPVLTHLKLKTTSSGSTSSNYYRGDKLGSGTSGTVYQVKHRFTGQHYALKEYDGSKPAGTFSEAHILRNLSHLHIVGFHEYFMNDGPPSLVMELVDGGNLREAHPLNPSELRECCNQLLAALAYIHDEKRLIHRDVKPDNIMVKCRDPIFIQLSDFGLACSANDPDRHHQGTPRYAAPEMVAKQSYTSKVDIWSLGIIALEFSSGLPEGYRKAKSEHLATLKSFLRSPQTLTLQFISSLLCEKPRRRPSASQSSNHPYLFSAPQPASSLVLYEPGPCQPTQILVADQEPTNLRTPNTEADASLVNIADLADTELWDDFPEPPAVRCEGRDGDMPDTAPGTSSHLQPARRRKRTAQSIGSKRGKRRARNSHCSGQSIEPYDGSDASTAVHDPLNDQEVEGCSEAGCDANREVDQFELPIYHPCDGQAGAISYYTERSYGDGSYLGPPPKLSFSRVRVTGGAHAEGSDTYHRSPLGDISILDPTYNAGTDVYDLNTQPANLAYAQDADAYTSLANDIPEDLSHLSAQSVNLAYAQDANAYASLANDVPEDMSHLSTQSVNLAYAQDADAYASLADDVPEDLPPLSARSVHHDDKGWYVTVQRVTIYMRAPDFFLNASKMWAAARSSKADHDMQFKRMKKVGALTVEGNNSWVPLREGIFLSEALGLHNDLEGLFSYAPENLLPHGEENYLLKPRRRQVRPETSTRVPKKSREYVNVNFLPWGNFSIPYNPDKRTINITRIFQSAGRDDLQTARPWLPQADIIRGNYAYQGTFIPYKDAIYICNLFKIETTHLDNLMKD